MNIPTVRTVQTETGGRAPAGPAVVLVLQLVEFGRGRGVMRRHGPVDVVHGAGASGYCRPTDGDRRGVTDAVRRVDAAGPPPLPPPPSVPPTPSPLVTGTVATVDMCADEGPSSCAYIYIYIKATDDHRSGARARVCVDCLGCDANELTITRKTPNARRI